MEDVVSPSHAAMLKRSNSVPQGAFSKLVKATFGMLCRDVDCLDEGCVEALYGEGGGEELVKAVHGECSPCSARDFCFCSVWSPSQRGRVKPFKISHLLPMSMALALLSKTLC